MKSKFLPCLVIIGLLANSCSDTEPWPNSKRYHKTENAIFYQAPQSAPESISAAYRPTSMFSLSDDVILYADSGTRHLVELDLKSGTQRALFDFSGFSTLCSESWGNEIIKADDNWYILAMPGQSLIWFNLTTGQTAVVGSSQPKNAELPNDNVSLQFVSFDLFGGIHRIAGGFYLAIANRVFYAPWDGLSPESLLNSRLEPIAGTLDNDMSDSPDPLKIKLHLFDYTYFAQKDGWLFFWDYRKLRAVRGGVTAVLTGDGYMTPNCTFDAFYAGEINESTPIVTWNDKLYSPYWSNHAVLEFDIDSINETTGTAAGMVKSYNSSGGTHNLAVSSRGLLSLDEDAGSFWLHPSIEKDELLFGPQNKSERYAFITDPDTPYYPASLIGPQAMTTIHDGDLALIYAPSIHLLSAFDLETNLDSPIWEVSFTHFTSDRKNQIWLADSRTLHFLDIDDDGRISNSYVQRFFSQADKMGIPCSRSILNLTEIPRLQVSDFGMLMYMPDNLRILNWDEDEVTAHHDQGWLYPSSMTKDEYSQSLAVHLIKDWQVRRSFEIALIQEDEEQYLTASNLSSKNASILGVTIEPQKMHRLSGGGKKAIEDGVLIEETKLNDIEAIALDSGMQTIFAARPGGLWRTNIDGTWQEVTICKTDASWQIRHLEVGGNSRYPIFLAKTDEGVFGCSARKMHFAGADFSDSWQKLDIDEFSMCSQTTAAYMRGEEVCIDALKTEEPTCIHPDGDISGGFAACSDSRLYISGMSDGRAVVWTAPLDDLQELKIWGGNGDGLPQKIEIHKAALGTELVNMGTDGIPYLYFMMRDTASIWRIPAYREIEADSITERILSDKRFLQAQAFAVSYDSTMAVIIDNVLYRADRDGLEALTELDGEILEMISIGHAFVVMTTEGIFTWENGRLRHAAENPAVIQGKSVEYAVPASVHPRMVQSPGENAVLVPVFEGSRIIKIAL